MNIYVAFHSGWGSVGGDSIFWIIHNMTCFAVIGHNNRAINYDYIELISNNNQYLIFYFIRNDHYYVSNSTIVGNKMGKYNSETLTFRNCIYDNKDFVDIGPNCVFVQTYSTNISLDCVNYLDKKVSNILKYSACISYSFLIVKIATINIFLIANINHSY